jgi:hypothetical protein
MVVIDVVMGGGRGQLIEGLFLVVDIIIVVGIGL